MDQMTQQFMGELQEFVHKAQKFLQESGAYGQRGFYGMRDGGGSGGNSGSSSSGGSYGQREMPWMNQGGMPGYPQQQNQGWGGQMPPFDPRMFM